jgi:carbon monoxide dehydrogenase subunit G
MEFHNEFDVKAPLDEVWDTMLDVERVAPCVPGAQVLERTGEDAYKVGIKVKVGPVSMQYRGAVEITDKDPSSHMAQMTAKAREARGQGTANANVRMSLSGNGDLTHGTINTEVQLSGRAAAMGQGVIKDVSARIVDQFAANLAEMLGGGGAAPAAEEQPTQQQQQPQQQQQQQQQQQPTQEQPAASAEPPSAAQAQAAPETPAPAPSSDEGLDVLPIVKSIAQERLRDPRVIGFGIVVLLLFLLRRRS